MKSPLGQSTRYRDGYDAGLLFPIDRSEARAGMGLGVALPFRGHDVWNGYEFSWLNTRGMPQVAGLRLEVPAASPRLVESKSMKLYLNGFAQTRFASAADVAARLQQDLSEACGAAVSVRLPPVAELAATVARLPGTCLDDLDIAVDRYTRAPELLGAPSGRPYVVETLHTHLFRSLCPVTAQPDWASLLISYRGPALSHEGLLRYLISYRQHQAFHEATVEQMFMDLKRCGCVQLAITGLFLRRGGLDINPHRSDADLPSPDLRTSRQ